MESPSKTGKLSKFLGDGFCVLACNGHFRDLPKKDFGIRFPELEPNYEIHKQDVLNRILAEARRSDVIYLSTDPDREGEAISWHLKCALGDDYQYRRAVFREITKKAVLKGIKEYGELDMNLVNAQQARRILDRFVGYELSPMLWKAFPGRGGLSAGRVQSVAVRLVVEREREIREFQPETFHQVFSHHSPQQTAFRAKLRWRITEGKREDFRVGDTKEAKAVKESILKCEEFEVTRIQNNKQQRRPQPPFTTQNLLAKAAHQLKLPAEETMKIAQSLYEAGHITYHRTDSTAIADEALSAVRSYIEDCFGRDYLPSKPQKYVSKGNTQEAHECIRPTSVTLEKPEGMRRDAFGVYQLIRDQFISCQMSNGVDAVSVIQLQAGGEWVFEARGRTEIFDGFRRLNRGEVEEKSAKKREKEEDEKQRLPVLKKGDRINLDKLEMKKTQTKAPPRYSEASLIKKLEREGIGRPSTYAGIVSTIRKRGYVDIRDRMYHALALGEEVTDYLVQQTPDIVDPQFTSRAEKSLDEISSGKLEWKDYLREFWSGFKDKVYRAKSAPPPRRKSVECPECGGRLFFQREDHRSPPLLRCEKCEKTFPSTHDEVLLQRGRGPKCGKCKQETAFAPDKHRPGFYAWMCSSCGETIPANWHGARYRIPVCPQCKKATQHRESPKWKERFFYCCDNCKKYFEAAWDGYPLPNARWMP